MWTHLFTLRALAREFHAALRNSVIGQAFTQHKNELVISTPSGKEYSLVVSVDPRLNFALIRPPFPRARKNSVDIFPDILGKFVLRIESHPNERIVFVHLDSSDALCLQLFGTAESNVFLVDKNWTIQKAFKESKTHEGRGFEFVPVEPHLPRLNEDLLAAKIRASKTTPAFAALKSAMPAVGSTYAREVLHRVGIDERKPVGELSEEEIHSLFGSLGALLNEVEHIKPTVYFRNEEPRVFSLVPLKHLSGARSQEFSSVNDAIRATVFRSLRTQSVESAKKDFIRKLKAEHDRTYRALIAAREELAGAGRAEQYERTANTIMANIIHLTKGTKVVDLDDVHSGARTRIEMDPKLTPAQNAERYFMRAKKAKAAREQIEGRAKELETKLALAGRLLLHLDQCQTEEQVEEFQREHREVLAQWNIITPGTKEKQLPFRVFRVAGNFEVWVGKSSQNNDLLTMHYAKPNDLWFHVRGAGGSHVVLKASGGRTMPPKEAIMQAARITAYYSKMRNASMVPVAYCERKYVRKPKGVELGTVVMQREKVVFVEPRLP